MNTWQEHPWMGVFPATLCAFHEDESLDEAGLRAYIRELVAVPGLNGLVPNGITHKLSTLTSCQGGFLLPNRVHSSHERWRKTTT